jgi:hypothetical protein
VITLTGPGIRVQLLPERGGKITSLLDTSSGREWLEAPAGVLSGPVDAGVDYDAGDMCGWDEMVPTISACDYPSSSLTLPDHGELWTKPWDVTSCDATSVTTTVRGDALAYQFERTLRLGERSLRVDYCVTTESELPLHLLWAAHPLFAVAAGTRLVLAPNDFDSGATEMSVADEFAVGTSAKFFAQVRAPMSTAALIDARGTYLALRWNRDDAPYVGVWLDNRHYSRHPVVGLEPTNCPFDSLAEAVAASTAWSVTKGRPQRWGIDVELGGPASKTPGSNI